MIRRSAFYFVVAIFLSCTEKEASKDKYPNIPYFPESSSKKYVFKKMGMRGSVRLENFIVLGSYDRPPGNFMLFDLKTADLRELRIPGTMWYIDRLEGSIIARMNDSTFVRYEAPTFAGEMLPFKKYYKAATDSTKKTRPILNLPIRFISDSTAERFPCATSLPDRLHTLIREREGSFIVDSRWITGELDECDHLLDAPFPKTFLTPFDQVVLSYSFSGSNHIAFGIKSKKLNYYRILIGRDTLVFKDHSDYFQFYQMPGQNPLILDGYDSLYEVRSN